MSNEINFSFIDYSFYTRSLDIFTIGCVANPRCEGCCNPELWDFSQEGISVSEALKKIQELNKMFNPLIDRICWRRPCRWIFLKGWSVRFYSTS